MTDTLKGMTGALSDVAVVLIGRNEGERLANCIASVVGSAGHVVYVDSGSTDGSVALAQANGCHVVELDMALPFSAARARNAGLAVLQTQMSDIRFVQFVDGDCIVEPNWLASARNHLLARDRSAAVFGQRTELYPERTPYNQLCQMEWQTEPGEVKYFGGDVMIRMESLAIVKGYRDDVIAGEEPELSVRLRQANWKIDCLDAPMTKHDAAITRFQQWWTRSVRTGYAFALGAFLHGDPPEFHWVRETRRIWFWGLLVPVVIGCSVLIFGASALLLGLVYLLQVLRLYMKNRHDLSAPMLASFFYVVGNLPQVIGQMRFVRDRVLGRTARLIEYK